MIISQKHKFIFIHIPKNGGTSLTKSLLDYCDIKNIIKDDSCVETKTWNGKLCVLSNSHPLYNHSTSTKVKTFFDLNRLNFNEYFVFSFTRNPWARELSMYNYMLSSSKRSTRWGNDCKLIIKRSPSFECYILNQKISAIKTGLYGTCDGDLQDSHYWNEFTDESYKLEDGQESVNNICKRINIEPFELLHTNKSTHEHYAKHYTKEMRDFIAIKCQRDIERHGYKF